MGRVILIHGVNTLKNRNHLCRIAPAFRRAGFDIVIPTYGYVSAFLIGMFDWLDDRIADSMSAFIRSDDVLVGHSNGGTLVHLISQRQRIKGAVLINPALDPKVVPNADFVHVYYNYDDYLARVSALAPFSPWGEMGGVGYLGSDPRVLNFNQASTPDLPRLSGHSDVFAAGKCRPWAKFMAQLCLKATTALENPHV